MHVFCFDFDGVICDSADETAVTGWRGLRELWPHLTGDEPSDRFMMRFRKLRPVIETGYESILLARMITEQMPEDQILQQFPASCRMLMQVLNIEQETLIELFANLRDKQIADDLQGWIKLHRFYPGVADNINRLIAAQQPVFILTTKQQKYAKVLAKVAGLQVPPKQIFGLEAGPKLKILDKVLRSPKFKGATVHFFEDRLPTLEKAADDEKLNAVQLYLANWGYVTDEEHQRAGSLERLHVLTPDDFQQLCDAATS